jgi:hypothetical protein
MYSDMSKRISSTPMMKASWRATSVLPTPVGPRRGSCRPAWRVAQAAARHLDRRGERVDRLVLAEHRGLQVAVEVLQRAAVVVGDVPRGHARDLGDDLLDLGLADHLLLLGLGQDALQRAGLVDHVDRLVRQVPVVDVARRELRRGGERVGGVLHAVVRLEARLQPAQDLHRLLDRRLVHVHLLEAPRQRVVLLEDAAEFLVGGRADALERARGERGLEQVGGVQRAARGAARADQRVDLVDEEDRVGVVDQLLQHRLQALLEVAAVLGAGEQRAHVERIHLALGEDLGHLPSTMRLARPSAMAVLPTPASPTSSGLFLRRRQRICTTRSSSLRGRSADRSCRRWRAGSGSG